MLPDAPAMVTVYANHDGSSRDNVRVSADGRLEVFDRSRTAPNLAGVEISYALLPKELLAYLPADGDELVELERLRREVRDGLKPLVVEDGADLRLDPADLASLLRRVPPRYRPLTGGCYGLQPADAEAGTWVLNRLFGGTGRLGSRFTPVMPEPLRHRYAGHLAARARLSDHDGEELELFDLMCVQGDTLNVHVLQTPRALELPGSPTHLPAARRRQLTELAVRFTPGRPPRLVDRRGRAYLPVHLGVASHDFMPALIRFLALLGPGELRPLLPPVPVRRQGEAESTPRLWMGDVVVRRRRFSLPAPELPAAPATDAAAYRAVDEWRRRHDLPRRVFWLEPRSHPVAGIYHKPQYLDWASPLFVDLFLGRRFDPAAPCRREAPRQADVVRDLEQPSCLEVRDEATLERSGLDASWLAAERAGRRLTAEEAGELMRRFFQQRREQVRANKTAPE